MAGCGRKKGQCGRCQRPLGFDFTMAFQPIVDVAHSRTVGYESLVRGVDGASAGAILAQVDAHNLYQFDQACRVRALELAHRLGLRGVLSINFLPNTVYEPQACIQATLAKAEELGWPADRLSFKIVETERVRDRAHLRNIVHTYRTMGFRTALDDFGSGYANVNLLADLRPTYIKIDRELIADVNLRTRAARDAKNLIALARRLKIGIIAEGVETLDEARWLYEHGVSLHQGYFYARPQIERLPVPDTDQLMTVRWPQAIPA